METQEFARRLDTALQEAPPLPPLESHVAAGRRALRRRRVLSAAGGVTAVVGLLGTTFAVADITDGERGVPPASAPQLNQQGIVTGCTASENVSERNRQRLFGAGPAELLASAGTEYSTYAALRSADGRFWGECVLTSREDAEFDSALTVYRTEPDRVGGLSYGWGCPQVPDRTGRLECEAVTFHMVDRRPEVVAEVVAVLADGTRVSTATHQGYFVLNTSFPVPDDVVMTPEGLPDGFSPLRSLAFYDTHGDLLARQSFVERLDGKENPDTLNEYPSQAGHPL